MDSLAESVIGKGRIIMNSEFCIADSRPGIFKIKKQCLSSEALAENICTNPARVRKVMAKLKKAGLVSTKEGSEGGYSLAKNAEQITLKQISAALQIEFVSSHWRSGSQNLDCMVASGMADVWIGFILIWMLFVRSGSKGLLLQTWRPL